MSCPAFASGSARSTPWVGLSARRCISSMSRERSASSAGHVKDRYDRLWAMEQASARDPGWHRTGDVGHLDAGGRLWVEGRLAHVITAADGPITPVGAEQRIEAQAPVTGAALVGVGPRGTQQPVAVVMTAAPARAGLADEELAPAVRAAAEIPLAAVLTVPSLPCRHPARFEDRPVSTRPLGRRSTLRRPSRPSVRDPACGYWSRGPPGCWGVESRSPWRTGATA